MYNKIYSSVLQGIDGYLVSVEVDVSEGFPRLDLVGLPDSTVKESIERVRTAIKNCGFSFPYKRITVNLAPADIRKVGAVYDLPIAVGILACSNYIISEALSTTLIVGELSLSGELRRVNGILPMIYCAYSNGFKRCIVPIDNKLEAGVVDGIEIIACRHLVEVVQYLNEEISISPSRIDVKSLFGRDSMGSNGLDFMEIRGQETAKRAIEVGAAGMHNILMIGPPGSGKTMMAKRVSTVLPDLTFDESIEITKIYSVSGLLKENESLITKRPFRSPHHNTSSSALVGGGRVPRPGEISLAHNGVLFLDELPEFQKNVLEVLRQPLEDLEVTISRLYSSITYPSNFMLICSMNPCPCGYYPDQEKCTCTPPQIRHYLNKISGPLLDRLDVQIEVGKTNYLDLSNESIGESSSTIKKRIQEAHEIQKDRYKKINRLFNSSLSSTHIKRYCQVEKSGKDILEEAFNKLELSARAYHRILKVARTIADLDGKNTIEDSHIAEAIQYRTLDRKYWGR